jgi:hypothetical protein
MVLWNNWGGLAGRLWESADARKSRSAGLEQGERREGFKPDATAGLNEETGNATTSACVRWDMTQYRKSRAFVQAAASIKR